MMPGRRGPGPAVGALRAAVRLGPLLLPLLASLLSCAWPGSAQPAGAGYPSPVGGTFRDHAAAPEMVVLPAGTFTMGATEEEAAREGRRADAAAFERPRRTVQIALPLAVSRYLVMRAEYRAFVSATQRPAAPGCNVLDGGKWQFESQRSFEDTAWPQSDRHPATCVDTGDAQAYAEWLSALTGQRYRLLHESEWEYAARAGTTTSRWWGDAQAAICNYANGADRSYERAYPGEPKTNRLCDDGQVQSSPVDAFGPNPFGLHDMLGNVWQWTADCFVAYDAPAPSTGERCTQRAIRGGSWHNVPDALRSAARFGLPEDLRSSSVGFRVMRQPPARSAGR